MSENLYEGGVFNSLKLTSDSYPILHHIAKWTKFLSILAFIFLGLSILLILSMGALITGMNQYALQTHNMLYIPGVFSWGHAILLLIIIGIYFVPVYFLFKFSTQLQKALDLNDTERLTDALGFLRNHYMYIGIITIIALIFYVICFLLMLLGIFTVM